ncbi:hypothetical protein EC957_009779 [Mortierella hygrophila]|uniref:Reverse transcriptase domain-containing protein n=1 Tax=Mortierella hygrophila TaxID=979708 RepID=A0A9P6FA01_9FUNG|nr:hypothetical protein EC957_009779 [Mortierella hygrophila]
MILLYKKGEASQLSNWRPLSLINCDGQSGFTAGRHIVDNGMVLNNRRDYCRNRKLKHVGVLLDQEMAYDRVHPEYLEMVMEI